MKKTNKILASLAIASIAITMIPFNAFATGIVPTRLAGITAEQTAVAIADQIGSTGTAILASSASYGAADALTAGPLAAFLNAPILLQGPETTLNADTKAELTKLAVKTVYVTSGTAVINQTVLDELKGMNITVESLGGNDRFDTSVNIAKKLVALGAPVKKVAVAYGWLNQDALSIASVASAANEPIILTEKAGLSASAKAFLAANLGITSADVIGGTGVIDDTVMAQLPSPTRHFGNTAYDTNNQVIQDFAAALTFGNLYLANGVTGIDALSGAPLAARTKSAIVLTDGVNVPPVAAFTYSKSDASSVVTALGGVAVVPESVRDGVAGAGKVITAPGDLAITMVSALNDTNQFLKIEFNKVVSGIQASDIVIKDAKKGDTYSVKAVTIAADGKSLTAELYQAKENENVLQENTEYTVTVTANGQTMTSTFYDSAFNPTDTTAPTATVTTASVNIGTNVTTVMSTEAGTAYLVLDGANLNTVAALNAAVTAGTAMKATVTANTATNIATAGLVAGAYKVIAVDAAGNVSAESTNTITLVAVGTVNPFTVAPKVNLFDIAGTLDLAKATKVKAIGANTTVEGTVGTDGTFSIATDAFSAEIVSVQAYDAQGIAVGAPVKKAIM